MLYPGQLAEHRVAADVEPWVVDDVQPTFDVVVNSIAVPAQVRAHEDILVNGHEGKNLASFRNVRDAAADDVRCFDFR